MSNLANGENSPAESTSMCSDGYNSGEQYDTLSTGYMSGEAYESSTPLVIAKPDLDAIDEHVDSDTMFVPKTRVSSSSSSSSLNPANNLEPPSIRLAALPMLHSEENATRTEDDTDTGLIGAGYRTIPSDTDTDNRQALLNVNVDKNKRRIRNKSTPRHDAEWFHAHDTKTWQTARLICFLGFIGSMLMAVATAAIMISLMPTECQPNTEWFQGKAFYHLQGKLDDLDDLGVFEGVILADTRRDLEEIITEAKNVSKKIIVEIRMGKYNESGILDMEHSISKRMANSAALGADGVMLTHTFDQIDVWVARTLLRWFDVFSHFRPEESSKALFIISHDIVHQMALKAKEESNANDREVLHKAIKVVGLVNFELDMSNLAQMESNMNMVVESIKDIRASVDDENYSVWMHWTTGTRKSNVNENSARAFTALLAFLPGSFSVKWSGPGIDDVIQIKKQHMPLYMNANYEVCANKAVYLEFNLALRLLEGGQVMQLERFFNRQHRYVLFVPINNEQNNEFSLARAAHIYSYGELILDTNENLNEEEKNNEMFVQVADLSLKGNQALMLRLPK